RSLRALQLEILRQLQADLDRRGRERSEDQLTNQPIHRLRADRLAARPAKGRRQLTAHIARLVAIVVVSGRHATTTLATTDEATQQGRSTSRDAVMFGAVRRHLLLIPRVGLPINVRRPAVPAQHSPLLR